MTKQSEYMEAFFGVELNTKFEDMISELKDAEESLKELSSEIGTLTQTLTRKSSRNSSRSAGRSPTRMPSRSRMSGRSLTSTSNPTRPPPILSSNGMPT